MREIVIEFPLLKSDDSEEKVYIKAYTDRDKGEESLIQAIANPRVLSDAEREEKGI